MIDILVISHASFRRVNRLIYNILSKEYGLKICILAPTSLVQGGKILETDAVLENDTEVIFRELKGANPRTYGFKGTIALLNELKPKMIYLDNDPISIQAINLGNWAMKNKSSLVCLTCENLKFDLVSSFKRVGAKGILFSVFKTLLLWFSRSNVSHVFAINKSGLEIYKSLGFKSVSLTPLGFDPKIFYPNLVERTNKRAELGINERTLVFAYIGRTVYEKGVHVLLKSLSLLEKGNWVFILDKFSATKTSYQEEIISLIEAYKLTDNVLYFDAPHAEIANYMNAADVVIVPSISVPKWVEQYGRVAPEAMACGKIVVASNVGALPEIIADAGILVEENNALELKNVLSKLISEPNTFAVLKEKALNRAHSKYSVGVQAKLLHETFKKLHSKV